MARNGKIARLPREIREELNRRLRDNEPGGALLEWLNGLPAAQALVAQEFGGQAISKQNLSEWRCGGHAEWLARQETLDHARELAAEAGELAAATDGRLADHVSTFLTAHYASLLRGWDGEFTEASRRRLRVLREVCQDVVELRRGDHSGARLRLEQERLERERERTEAEVVAHFRRWVDTAAVRAAILRDQLSPEDRRRAIREIYGLLPEEETPAAPAESNPVKPSQTEFPNPADDSSPTVRPSGQAPDRPGPGGPGEFETHESD